MFHWFKSEYRFSAAIADLLSKTGLAVLMLGAIADQALADPPPLPPTQLPSVFCFRFTDIKAVEDDPEGDKFQFTFEVLNWSDQPVGGVRIAMNTGTNSFVQDVAPSFAGAGIDGNGRPLGNDADPLPGNQLFTNSGQLVESNETAVQWTAGQFNFNQGTNGPIPNQDLLGVIQSRPRGGTAIACSMVPGCTMQGNIPVVADWETVDNGNNVLDGFTITVDDFDELESLSFNWNLLDVNGNPIGTPGQGNAYGFGTVNIGRIPIGSDPESEFGIRPLFPQNSGFVQTPNVFAENSYRVTEYGPDGYDEILPDGEITPLGQTSQPTILAEFAAEFGAGITAPFLNPADNIFASAINTQPIDYPNPGNGNPGNGNPGNGNPGNGNPGNGNPGNGNPGNGNPGNGNPGNGNPGNGNPGNGNPGNGNPGNGNPGNGNPGNGNPGNGDPGNGNPGNGDPVEPPVKVPEPSTLAMIGLAGVSLFGSKYRRRRKA